jgi:16S rRNA (adenine1518-N6/adenine1519-N6)-dimethyltransferase
LVVTIQREMADRLCAKPATSEYGAVSVLVQALADVSLIRVLPPSVFWPRPKVESAVVMLRPSLERRAVIGDVAGFQTLVRTIFQHRRKLLRHVLAGMWPEIWTKADVDQWLESQGRSGQVRAEALGVEDFILLAHALRERFGALPEDVSGKAARTQREGRNGGED